MPQLGETVAEGKILAWFKSVGDEIKEGDNLFEVETDKVTMEVQAIVAGRLSEIRVGPGLTAKVGEVVAVIGDGVAKAPSGRTASSARKAAQWRSPFEEVSTPADRFGHAKGPNGIHLTPLARRLIAQRGLDLAELAAEVQRKGKKELMERRCAQRSARDRLRPMRRPPRLRRLLRPRLCPVGKATSSR